ncbi:arginase [Aliiroseovarius lamellibrachiae]|uniref:arginase n=1 Tax=Aliiroseovarius lamellibrachiae TaxID=1924933 RepID=UPI001BE0CD90|nr:arginase [Aliiroseovarius lamellibrachiae]MBT2132478.1 arginase [Aliiroseovarius lamellibrachiae]
MSTKNIILVGAPMDSGKRRQGCRMGPDAYRVAGLADALTALGHQVADHGDVAPDTVDIPEHDHLVKLPECIGWTQALNRAAKVAAGQGMPIFMGGDHALSMGTVSGMAEHAKAKGRPLFVLWLDAHSDFHTPQSTSSGNLHGSPVAYFTGQSGFDAFPALAAVVPTDQVGMIGLRSVDPEEHAALQSHDTMLADMRTIDEHGIKAPLVAFLDKVRAANGILHVSLDVDFLDPSVAPAVGTTVPGGATEREGHLVMELLHDSGLVCSLDLVELNPFLDDRGRTAMLMVDLTASLLGRRVFDRPTRSF